MSVNKEQIDAWKAKHKKVFRTIINDTEYYFTTLKKEVYVDLVARQQLEKDFDYEYEVMKACVIFPEITPEFKAECEDKSGLGVVLMEQIMLNSGWQQIQSEEL